MMTLTPRSVLMWHCLRSFVSLKKCVRYDSPTATQHC